MPMTHQPPDLVALTGLMACVAIIALCGAVLAPWVENKLAQRRQRREDAQS